MKSRSLLVVLSAAAGLTACVPPTLSVTYTDPEDDEVLNVPPDDTIHLECRVEGAHIGTPGVEVAIDGEVATIVAWQAKPSAPDQFIGFTLEFSGDLDALAYDIAAGDEKYPGAGLSWSNPSPDADAAEPIELIDFCDIDLCLLVPQLPFCPPPPECSDPEGCPPWGDGEPGDDDEPGDDEPSEPTEPGCSDPSGCLDGQA
jgi:hypothetical protein